jgi:cytochrome c554/c'-like protein
MRTKHVALGLTVAVALLVAASASAYPQFARDTKAACAGCHVSPAGGHELNDAGKAFKADKKAPEGEVAGADYVGINKCKMCHIKQYTAWKTSKHATALATLHAGDPAKIKAMADTLKVELSGDAAGNDNCVTCHVTGFKLPGGYPAADSAKTAAVSNVTCENCHGPGSKHVAAAAADKKKMISREVRAEMCMQCHTAVTSPKFKYDAYKAKIVHWKTD